MTHWLPQGIFGGGAFLLAVIGADVVSPSSPFGYIGPVLIAILGAFSLWRAGSVKAWKETAEGRLQRIEDLAKQNSELRSEIAMPERVEGLIKFMADQAEKADERSQARLDHGLIEIRTYVDSRLGQHERLAIERHAELLIIATRIADRLDRAA